MPSGWYQSPESSVIPNRVLESLVFISDASTKHKSFLSRENERDESTTKRENFDPCVCVCACVYVCVGAVFTVK